MRDRSESQRALALVPVEVCGESINAASDGQVVWVSVRRVCEALGLQPEEQAARLRGKPWAITEMIRVAVESGNEHDLLCVSHRSLPMWLATLTPSPCSSPDMGRKFARFQVEAADVLADHFFGPIDARARNFAYRLGKIERIVGRTLEPVPQRPAIGPAAANDYVRAPLNRVVWLKARALNIDLAKVRRSLFKSTEDMLRLILKFPRARGHGWGSFPAARVAELQVAVGLLVHEAEHELRLVAPERRQLDLFDDAAASA